jgi:hypothetical protein
MLARKPRLFPSKSAVIGVERVWPPVAQYTVRGTVHVAKPCGYLSI